MKVVIGILGWLALIAAGIYVDVVLLLVGGINEIVKGATAHPINGDLVGWGIAHVVFCGVGVFVAILLGIGLTAILAAFGENGKPEPVHYNRMRMHNR